MFLNMVNSGNLDSKGMMTSQSISPRFNVCLLRFYSFSISQSIHPLLYDYSATATGITGKFLVMSEVCPR